ncbi:succinate dehydrogenase, partial [Staphylococcus aureus]|nr:succinate dehydrogenase [Staphylococcus aureus]
MAQSKMILSKTLFHSLLGIIPIGAFLVVHLLVNHQATQ